jgi:hypothetical protein
MLHHTRSWATALKHHISMDDGSRLPSPAPLAQAQLVPLTASLSILVMFVLKDEITYFIK